VVVNASRKKYARVPRKSPQYDRLPALVALGGALRALRIERGLSQEALAQDAEIDRSYLGGIERGEHNVAVVNLLKLAGQLDTTLADLMRAAKL
jgi:transcriptional regulator with XRE-family HTH domain